MKQTEIIGKCWKCDREVYATLIGMFCDTSDCKGMYIRCTKKKEILEETIDAVMNVETSTAETSDGSSADYYKLHYHPTELQDIISHDDMNAQIGEIFRACKRYGKAAHSDKLRDAKKMKFYIEAEIARLTPYREE